MVTDHESNNALLVMEVLFDLVLWTVIILFLAVTGSRTNHLNFLNRMRLTRHMGKAQNLKAMCEDKLRHHPLQDGLARGEDYSAMKSICTDQLTSKIESLKSAMHMLEWSLDQLEVIDETEHEMVLGFRADIGLVNGLVTLLISTAVYATRQLLFQAEF